MQRLPFKGAKEIEEMLLGKLPDIRNTRSGQELIAIGIEQGIEQGIEKGITQGINQGIEQGIEQGIKKGREEGIDQGKLVGQIQLLESLCNSISTMEAHLRRMSLEELKSRVNELRDIFDARQ
jgi:flagellar biosynthesis/type III secretory pathway protein FliH